MRGVDTWLALRAQTDLYTPQLTSALVAGDFLAFNSESLSGNQQVISNPAIRQKAMQTRAYTAMGTVDAGGAMEFTASNYVLNAVLPYIFHSKTSTADAADGLGATYTLVDGGTLTPFTTFVGLDGDEGAYTRIFEGCKVNTASFSARVNDFLRMNVNVAAINKALEDGAVAASYQDEADEYAFVYDQAAVTLRAGDMSTLVEIPVESLDININHNLATNAYRLGSQYRRSLFESMTDVDGTFTLDAATAGIGGPTVDPLDQNAAAPATHDPSFWERVAREAVFGALEVTFTDTSQAHLNETIADANDGDPASFKIALPYIRLEEPSFNITDTGVITGSARFSAYDSITATHVGTLEIV